MDLTELVRELKKLNELLTQAIEQLIELIEKL